MPARHHHKGLVSRDNTAGPEPVVQLISIAPTSSTCEGASFADECVVSSTSVVQALIDSFSFYNVTTAEEQAALLSWMAFESGDFKYNKNHFPAPGRPGQGTRTMMMPKFVMQFMMSIPELNAKAQDIMNDSAKVLELVLPDQYSFASAAWFYSTICTDEHKVQVRTGGRQGWEQGFIQGCVQTTIADERAEYWIRARKALGVEA
jgi:hypothetical protein